MAVQPKESGSGDLVLRRCPKGGYSAGVLRVAQTKGEGAQSAYRITVSQHGACYA